MVQIPFRRATGEAARRPRAAQGGRHAAQLASGRRSRLGDPLAGRKLSGGERGIRTLEGLLTLTPLAGVRLRPLGHLSAPWECLSVSWPAAVPAARRAGRP